MQAGERRLKLLKMSLDYGLYPTEADLSELQEFFPQVNLKKIYEVERYHKNWQRFCKISLQRRKKQYRQVWMTFVSVSRICKKRLMPWDM